jgi:hypothetical protein
MGGRTFSTSYKAIVQINNNTIMNYENDITIDPDALDTEWLDQPRLMLKYLQHLARVRRTLDEAKQALDVAKAEADYKIRNFPKDYSIEKITDAVVANAILCEEGYKKAYTEFLEAKFEVDMAQAAVSAFDHRKAALENEVKLFGMGYFAGPKLPRDINAEWEKRSRQEQSNKAVASGMQRRRKDE